MKRTWMYSGRKKCFVLVLSVLAAVCSSAAMTFAEDVLPEADVIAETELFPEELIVPDEIAAPAAEEELPAAEEAILWEELIEDTDAGQELIPEPASEDVLYAAAAGKYITIGFYMHLWDEETDADLGTIWMPEVQIQIGDPEDPSTILIPETDIQIEIKEAASGKTTSYNSVLPSFETAYSNGKVTVPELTITFPYADQTRQIVLEQYWTNTKGGAASGTTGLIQDEFGEVFDFTEVADTNELHAGILLCRLGSSASSGNASSDYPVVVSAKSKSSAPSLGSTSGTKTETETTGTEKVTSMLTGRKTVAATAAKAAQSSSATPKVSLNLSQLTLRKGATSRALHASGLIAGDKVKSWKSSKPSVVSVSSTGKLTAKKAGTAVITIRTKQGATAKVKVTVKKASVKLNRSRVTLRLKKKPTVSFAVKGLMSGDSIQSWKSSKPSVARISGSGVVTALKKGLAKITVRTKYGAKATASIKVKK